MPTKYFDVPQWRDEITVPNPTVPDIAGRDIDPRRRESLRLYISGPMRGIPAYNFPAFDECRDYLRSLGHQAVSPADHDRAVDPLCEERAGFRTGGDIDPNSPLDFNALMVWDLEQVIHADGIVLLPGWEKSTGAGHELDVALACGKCIFVVTQNGLFEKITADQCAAIRSGADEIADLNGEHRVIDPETGGAKGQKRAQLGALDPAALLDVARVAGFGGEKYERYNFAKGYAWSLSFDALQRHLLAFWGGEDTDPESGEPHAAHAAWHCLALLTFLRFDRGTDDRFPLRG